ncbi:hypothetical protein F2Q68_00038567 [Brassica cretica]|uniref:Uncharacterized protein n=1 Tax=Brassica cretica TaxID=69181 RepID=A0A8S9ME23_BRACR|nr:hypothetical protein F2Q68_00038567 [Brassica cretica]
MLHSGNPGGAHGFVFFTKLGPPRPAGDGFEQERLTITGQSSKLSSTKMKVLLSIYPPTSPRLSARRLVLRLTEMARSGDGDLDD